MIVPLSIVVWCSIDPLVASVCRMAQEWLVHSGIPLGQAQISSTFSL